MTTEIELDVPLTAEEEAAMYVKIECLREPGVHEEKLVGHHILLEQERRLTRLLVRAVLERDAALDRARPILERVAATAPPAPPAGDEPEDRER